MIPVLDKGNARLYQQYKLCKFIRTRGQPYSLAAANSLTSTVADTAVTVIFAMV